MEKSQFNLDSSPILKRLGSSRLTERIAWYLESAPKCDTWRRIGAERLDGELEGVDPSIIVGQLALMEGIGVAVISGVVALILKRMDKKRETERESDMRYRRKREKQEEDRKKRDTKLYAVVLSTARGTQVLLHQAHGDHLNGDVEHSLKSIDKSISEFNELANEQMANL